MSDYGGGQLTRVKSREPPLHKKLSGQFFRKKTAQKQLTPDAYNYAACFRSQNWSRLLSECRRPFSIKYIVYPLYLRPKTDHFFKSAADRRAAIGDHHRSIEAEIEFNTMDIYSPFEWENKTIGPAGLPSVCELAITMPGL